MAYQQRIIDYSAGKYPVEDYNPGTSLFGGALAVTVMGSPMGRTVLGVPPVGIPVGGALGIPVEGAQGIPVSGKCVGPMYTCNCVRCHPPSTELTLAPPGTTVERGARGRLEWPTLIKQLVPPPTFANYGPRATSYKRYGKFANATFPGLRMPSSMVAGPSTLKSKRSGSSRVAAARTSSYRASYSGLVLPRGHRPQSRRFSF